MSAKTHRTVKLNNLEITSDNSFPMKSLYALEIPIFNIENGFAFQRDFYGTSDGVELVKIAQGFDCDILSLKFNIEDDSEIAEAVGLLKKLLPHIEKPLMIRGINKDAIDKKLIPQLAGVLERECILAFANENTYKEIVTAAVKGGHIVVLRSPIDINLAKELNILSADLGQPLDKILIDTDIGGLGYGLEYGYSIMEKVKLEGISGDEYLSMPLITFAAEESLKTKETKSDNFSKSWGTLSSRTRMFELASASAVRAAGASIIVINHPENLKILKGLV